MKIRLLSQDKSEQAIEHEALGIPPLEEPIIHLDAHPWRKPASYLLIILVLGGVVFWLNSTQLIADDWQIYLIEIKSGITNPLFIDAFLVGLGAQIIDGALGMAYGITATTFLLYGGVSPAVATASVHLAEVFTTGFSGISHWRFGNIDKKLFKKLLLPGVAGVIVGSWIITSIDGNAIKPWISLYLLSMGIWILIKAFRKNIIAAKNLPRHLKSLAFTGGFVDSVGGGGWGPVVTTSLVGRGHDPRLTIGSVNAAEFFLALTGAISFSILGAFTHWQVIAGLVMGGLFAAPFAAWLCKKLHAKTLLIMVGVLISGLSILNIYRALF